MRNLRLTALGLGPLLLSLTGCAFFSSPQSQLDINEENVRIAFVALDADAESQGFSFLGVAPGDTETQTLTLQNYGQLPAREMTMARLSEETEFDFVGGEYPGTGGTCADTLEPEETCTLVISFSPATAGTFTSEFELSYFNGFDTYTEAFTVTGIAATP